MLTFWFGLGIGIGMVLGVFLAVGLLVCYLAGWAWELIKGRKHYGF